MSKKYGAWVDHRKAVLVLMEGGSATVSCVESKVEVPVETSGGWRSGGAAVPQCISNEQTEEARRKNRLHDFYQEVIKAIRDGEELYIFGPGEAKHELGKEIEKIKGPHIKITAVEACDKLTKPQTVARVKSFYKR